MSGGIAGGTAPADSWCVRSRRPRPTAHPVIPWPRRRPSWVSSSFTTAGGFAPWFALTTQQLKRRCDPRRPPAAPDHCCGASRAVKHAPTQPQAAERLQTRRTRQSRRDARNRSRLNMLAQIFKRQCYNTRSNSVTLSCVTFRAMWIGACMGGRAGRERGGKFGRHCALIHFLFIKPSSFLSHVLTSQRSQGSVASYRLNI